MTVLVKQPNKPGSTNLVFTSAGDNSNLSRWIGNDKDYDLWVTYYGKEDDRYINTADYYMKRQGGKFPNLKFAYDQYTSLFSAYQAVWVVDDDIILKPKDINKLFAILMTDDLWVLQPGFDKRSKISYSTNEAKPFTEISFTSFVEENCPLFRADKLFAFLDEYDAKLPAYGIDLWFSEFLSREAQGAHKLAVIDSIICVNPRDEKKSGLREIDKLHSQDTLIANFAVVSTKYGLTPNYTTERLAIKRSFFNSKILANSCRILLLKLLYITYKKISGGKIHPTK